MNNINCAYFDTLENFYKDVENNKFIKRMEDGAVICKIGASINEKNSWLNNSNKLYFLFKSANLAPDVYISFEFKLPYTQKRIDCVLFGIGEDKKPHMIHIELKQWDNTTVKEINNYFGYRIEAYTGGAFRVVLHPSEQVKGYQRYLMNYVSELSENKTILNGCGFCYNYYKNQNPNDLYSAQYQNILKQYYTYPNDDSEKSNLKQFLCKQLSNGKGTEIFTRICDSEIRQSKKLLEVVAEMFEGNTEFALLDDQIIASDTIFNAVKDAISKNEKKVIIVKGGPGTGKTLIALDVLSKMAKNSFTNNMYFTTRSKALRESLKVQLSNYKDGSAVNLISNIYNFKPCNFKESEIDLLMIDEAHRVESTANYMGDKFEQQTYLSMAMSLMYCSKVCVFFIDDKQVLKTSEIGDSEDLYQTALNYRKNIYNYEDSKFYQDLMKLKNSLDKNESKRDELDISDIKTQLELDEKIKEQKRQLKKLDNIKDVKSTLTSDIDVEVVELKSQFRCNGSDNYLDWLDQALYLPGTEIDKTFSEKDYLFEICSSPEELYKRIVELNKPKSTPKQVARLVAGYCWKWTERPLSNGDLAKDVKIGSWSMPWETNQGRAFGEYTDKYASSADTWVIEDAGINQIGCIFSIQGFELDYVGVILGPDIKYDRESDSLIGVPNQNMAVKCNKDNNKYTTYIRNAYRVLMTRGKKGCLIYSTDKKVSEFLLKTLHK